ncbi:MAG: response regulator transcription factor [Bacteroidia bacterium]|jgi:DNA-binding NarL/FixJ family response regulator|nr:response regulator transcription factor [Paludibacter sp.]MDD3489137.1 response regulator transcription factor [Paludibacter sp.]NCB68445.1 response regulator transcription factor [Bacteroidia bacterium]
MRDFILCDNQDITRYGFEHLVRSLGLSGEFYFSATKADLLNQLVRKSEAVVLFDYTRFDFVSVDELAILQLRFPKTDWIVFSDELSNDFVRSLVFNTQNFSVLLKDSSLDEIKSCIREVLRANRFICNRIGNMLLDSPKTVEKQPLQDVLTATEKEILKEIAMGKTTREIATQRFVSVHTIMTHRKNIFRKLEVNNVHEATKFAMRSGLVDMAEYYI